MTNKADLFPTKECIDDFIDFVFLATAQGYSINCIASYARRLLYLYSEPILEEFAYSAKPVNTRVGVFVDEYIKGELSKMSFKDNIEDIFGF